jgi:hypothetical protein
MTSRDCRPQVTSKIKNLKTTSSGQQYVRTQTTKNGKSEQPNPDNQSGSARSWSYSKGNQYYTKSGRGQDGGKPK